MIQVQDISLQHGERVLFDEVSFSLSNQFRYILVGSNGSGKSSFLKLLSKESEPTLGEITYSKSSIIGCMKQDHHLYDDLPLIDVVIKGRLGLWQALQRKEAILLVEPWTEAQSTELIKLEEEIDRLDGYRASADAASLLMGLGLAQDRHEAPLKSLSGGWKMRVLLAQLLFTKPDVLLLDEPTNYLDIESIGWLEGYLLGEYRGTLIVVSHDVHFLQKIGTCVLDVDYGQILPYPGTYEQFLLKKEEIAELKAKEHANVEQKVAKMRRFVERFRAKASKAKQAASREKMIDKVQWPQLGRSSRKSPIFSFQIKAPSGQIPIKIKGIYKLFDPNILIGPLNCEIIRGQRVAFIGPNGGGKTTLIKMITKELEPEEGTVEYGHRLSIALFAQEHKHLFTGAETVLEWLEDNVPFLTTQKRQATLGSLLFNEDDIKKKITMLSGGEMARLLLAKVMLAGANFLVLDEPTNHLDLESKEALAKALTAFKGTILFVSHDRAFIEQVATQVIEINRDTIRSLS